mgnify:CR=1 FL=1
MGELLIHVHVAPGVDDGHDAGAFAADDIGMVGETVVLEPLRTARRDSCSNDRRSAAYNRHDGREHPTFRRVAGPVASSPAAAQPRHSHAVRTGVRHDGRTTARRVALRREPVHAGPADSYHHRRRRGGRAAPAGRRLRARGAARRFSRALDRARSTLEAGAAKTFNLTLEPGPITETVRVTADRVQVRAGSGAVGEVFDSQVLTMTPVASRDVGDMPGKRRVPRRQRRDPGCPAKVARRERGRRARGVEQLPARRRGQQRPYLNRVLVTPSIDAVQEFTLLTNNLRRPAWTQRRRAGERRLEVGWRPHARFDVLPTSATVRSRRRGPFDPPSEPEPFRRRGQAGGDPGRADRRSCQASHSSAWKARAIAAPDTRVAHVPDAVERTGDFSAERRCRHRPVHGRTVPGQPDSGVAARPDRHDDGGPYSLPNRAETTGNFVSSPIGPRDVWQVTGRSISTCQRSDRVRVRYSFARRRQRPLAFPGPRQNLPRFGTLAPWTTRRTWRPGSREPFGRARSTTCASAWNRLHHDVFPDNTGVDGFARLGMARAIACAPTTLAIPRSR